MSGYKDWISDIDIKIDYYAAFMKAWIAFNAWYNNSGDIEGKTDAEHIEAIAYKHNRFKSYMVGLIEVENSEGASYRDNIANLHEALQSAALETQEYVGTRQTIAFSNIAIKNKNGCERMDYYGCRYECTRARGKVIMKVIKDGSEIFSYEQDEYSEEDLTQQSSFKQLSAIRQGKCIECYRKMQPYKIDTILEASENQEIGKKMGMYKFVDDAEKISRAIILVLYMLRCCLAHGDFSPDSRANEVYKYAYEVLCAPLKKLL